MTFDRGLYSSGVDYQTIQRLNRTQGKKCKRNGWARIRTGYLTLGIAMKHPAYPVNTSKQTSKMVALHSALVHHAPPQIRSKQCGNTMHFCFVQLSISTNSNSFRGSMQWWDWSINFYHCCISPADWTTLLHIDFDLFSSSSISSLLVVRDWRASFRQLCDVTAGFLVNIFYPERTGALL